MTDTRGHSLEAIGRSDAATPHKQVSLYLPVECYLSQKGMQQKLLSRFKRKIRGQAPPAIPLHPVGAVATAARRLSAGQATVSERRPSARSTRTEIASMGFSQLPEVSPVAERPAVFEEEDETPVLTAAEAKHVGSV